MNTNTGETKTIDGTIYEVHIINDRTVNIDLPDTNIYVDGDMIVNNIKCKHLYVYGSVDVYGNDVCYGYQYVDGYQDVRGDQNVDGDQDVRAIKKN